MKTVIKCEHCSETKDEHEIEAMERHEKNCEYNPKNSSCQSCKYMESTFGGHVCFQNQISFYEREFDINWCNKYKKNI